MGYGKKAAAISVEDETLFQGTGNSTAPQLKAKA
jgi:hypothetical protein